MSRCPVGFDPPFAGLFHPDFDTPEDWGLMADAVGSLLSPEVAPTDGGSFETTVEGTFLAP